MEKAGEYKELLTLVKEQIQAAQVKTVIAANSQMLCLYWKLGNYILQNQSAKGWGAKVIDKLSADIRKDFPLLKGLSARNLRYMKRFAEIYPVHVLQEYFESVEFLNINPKKIQKVIAKMEAFENQPFAIWQQPVAKLAERLFLETILSKVGWAHHVILMDKANSHSERLWYLLNTLEMVSAGMF